MTQVLDKSTFDVSDYLDYNYGVNETDFSISFINTPAGNLILKQNEIENPLFIGENGGSVLKLSAREIYNFSRVFVVCMRDNYVDSPELYNSSYSRVIDKTVVTKLSSNYAFLKTSRKLLDETYYKRCANVVSRELLTSLYNLDGSTLENEEIIIPMFELTESDARMNLSMYDTQFGLTDVKKFVSLAQFYNKENHRSIISHLSEHLGNLRESQFWSNPRNCNINATQKFQRRGFITRDKKQKANIKEISKDLATSQQPTTAPDDKLLKSLLKQKQVTDINYVSFDDDAHADPYVDLHTVLKTSKHRTYFMDDLSKLELSKDDITELFMSLESEQEMYNFFNTLAVSKEYCHTVINNKDVLIKMKPLFDKYLPFYKLIFGYAWLSFVLEEYIMKSKSTIDNRFVFDLDTAQHLPFFPYIFDDLHQNPYIVAPIDLNVINANRNAMGLFCIDDWNGYGVCDQETFRTRINLITTGDAKQNILDGIDWNSFAITGSSITACIQKQSPLFLNVESKTSSIDENMLKFFNSYYTDSDIDLMCNEPSIFGFTERAEQAIKQIEKNIKGYKEGDVTIEPIKSLYICLSKHFFIENCDDINDVLRTSYTPDQLVEHCDNHEFREYLYPVYVTNKQRSNASIRKSGKKYNEYMQHFMDYSSSRDIKIDTIKEGFTENTFDSDISLYVNDFRSQQNKVPDEDNHLMMKICEGIKFKISSKKLRKPIELFRCKTSDFFGVVGKFHLPCVRSYNKGDKVYLMPTTITAMMTGINLDYRYFVGVKNQFDILNKYDTRAYGTILSKQELDDMIDYNLNSKADGGMYAIKSKSKEDLDKAFGGKELTHPIFRPLEFKQGLTGVYNTPNVKYIKTLDDLREYYKKKCGYSAEKFGIDMMKFTTYSPSGDINPYMSSISKIYYDVVNAHKSKYNSSNKKKIIVEKISKKV
jgi:hypothetical protein